MLSWHTRIWAADGLVFEFDNAEVISNAFVIGTIEVGDEACVGTSRGMGHELVIGEGTELPDLTAVCAGARLGAILLLAPLRSTPSAASSQLSPRSSCPSVAGRRRTPS